MVFRDGKLVHMREFWDPKRILDARAGRYDLEKAS
jgi:ketosteroid isomerase-like protein